MITNALFVTHKNSDNEKGCIMLFFAATLNIAITKTIKPQFKAIQFGWFHVMWMPNEKAKIMLRHELNKDKPKVINKIVSLSYL